jgi:hypothetical protein
MSIYGDDDRKEVYQATAQQQKLAQSVVALFSAARVKIDPQQKTATLLTEPYTELHRIKSLFHYEVGSLKEDVRFYGQPRGAFCSGTLVAPDIVLTAGHCNARCKSAAAAPETETLFIFGFSAQSDGTIPQTIPTDNVYSCVNAVGHTPQTRHDQHGDWQLLLLDRPVKDRETISLSKTPELKVGEKVWTIGHSEGLPAKVSTGARVRGRGNIPFEGPFYAADLDTLLGNSGGPVFDSHSRLVGIVSTNAGSDYETVSTPQGGMLAPISYPNKAPKDSKDIYYTGFSEITDETMDAYKTMTTPVLPHKMPPLPLDTLPAQIEKAWPH